jgi:polysaccharide biosynthesis/export protein
MNRRLSPTGATAPLSAACGCRGREGSPTQNHACEVSLTHSESSDPNNSAEELSGRQVQQPPVQNIIQTRRNGDLRSSIRGLALLLGAIFLIQLCGCSPGSDLPSLPSSAATTTYKLGPGDQLRMITFGDQTLTGDFFIDAGGDIAVPLLGPVRAQGMTTNELASNINDLLRKKDLFRNPSVAIEVIAYRPIFVLGEVNKPGEFPYEPGMTVLTAVALAGGFTYRAVQEYASIVRSDDGNPSEGKVARSTAVQPGDVITIFERQF